MQPYLFPYIGYFQLINAVDKFIIYDDVNFIKQGWINRNKILVDGIAHLFTVPLNNQSSFNNINLTIINEKLYMLWVNKFLNTIRYNYQKAPYYSAVFPLLQKAFQDDEKHISTIAIKSLKLVCDYLQIFTVFELSSMKYENQHLSSQNRVLDICTKEHASNYINPIGGVDLYSQKAFLEKNIILNFIKPLKTEYVQFNKAFVPNLSIIDVLMFNDISSIKKQLNNYELV